MSRDPSGSPRLLVLCGASSAQHWASDGTLGNAACEWADDLYGALARLVAEPTAFDALLFMPESLSRAVVAAIPLVRKHLDIPIWILDKNAAIFDAQIEQALTHGAERWQPQGHALPSPVAANRIVPETTLHPVLSALNGNGQAQPHPLTGKIPIKSEQEIAERSKPVAIDSPSRYDGSTQEPLLTDAELKALLDDER